MLIAVVLDTLPLTVEVSTFAALASMFEVEDATILVRSVVVATPFTVEVRTVPDVPSAFEEITLEVAIIPFTFAVSVLPMIESARELMILVKSDETPFTIVAKVLVVVLSAFELIAVVVAITPFTVEVMVLVAEVITLVVGAVVSVVVDTTPFTVDVRRLVLVAYERLLELMMLDVATRPLIVVVAIFPALAKVKELMRLARLEMTPLVMTWKTLPDEEATFVLIIVVVAVTPLITLVIVFTVEAKELVIELDMPNELVATGRYVPFVCPSRICPLVGMTFVPVPP